MRTLVTSIVAVASTLTTPAVAQEDALVVHCAGIKEILVDKRDRGLRDALEMVDARLAELPRELPDGGEHIQVVRMVWDMLTGPMTLQVGMDRNADPAQGMPFYAQVLFDRGRRQRAALAEQFAMLLDEEGPGAGKPVPGDDDFRVVDLTPMRLYYGVTRQGFSVSLNQRRDVADAPDPGLPRGVKPVLSLDYNGPAAQPFYGMLLAQLGPSGEMLGDMLRTYGLTGPQASSFIAAMGYGDDRAHVAWRYTNYVPVAERLGMLVREPLTSRELSLVPADASLAEVGKYDFGGLAQLLRHPGEALGFIPPEELDTDDLASGMDAFARETGVHPIDDLIAHLGDTYGFYMSDTTGGGDLMSAVLFIETTNAEALSKSLARLADTFNEATAEETHGYVRLHRSRHEGVSMTTLMFPGLPIPLEISWTVSNGYLFVGATPYALIGAVKQAEGGRRSLLDHAGFREMGGEGWSNASFVSFIDTPRFARRGYGLLQLGCSALANVVRSPHDDKRDPGFICPSFHELVDDAKVTVNLCALDGDDLVGIAQGDRSVLVNLAGAAGLLSDTVGALAGGPLLVGVMLPALSQAQQKARMAKSSAQLRAIGLAVATYAAESNDRLPKSWDDLVDGGYLTRDLLRSPLGPVDDGRGDYWMNTRYETGSALHHPDRTVAFYDRAMFEDGKTVAVGFFDGHTETMSYWDFLDLMGSPENEGTDFDLPGWD